MAQFSGDRQPQRLSTVIKESSRASTDIFEPTDYVPHRNTEVPYDISFLTDLLMEIFPKATEESLMSHANLRYADIRVGNKGACLNFNLLGICSDPNCSYRHTKANASSKRIK